MREERARVLEEKRRAILELVSRLEQHAQAGSLAKFVRDAAREGIPDQIIAHIEDAKRVVRKSIYYRQIIDEDAVKRVLSVFRRWFPDPPYVLARYIRSTISRKGGKRVHIEKGTPANRLKYIMYAIKELAQLSEEDLKELEELSSYHLSSSIGLGRRHHRRNEEVRNSL